MYSVTLILKPAEGMGFEPMRGISPPNRLAGGRTRPLCDPSDERRQYIRDLLISQLKNVMGK